MTDDTGSYVIDLGNPKSAAIRDTAPGATVAVLVCRDDDPTWSLSRPWASCRRRVTDSP
jgi:hypothetical protein